MVKNLPSRDFCGGPVAKTVLAMWGARVRSLAMGLDPTCSKTHHNQINK